MAGLGTRGRIFISYRRDDAPGDARGVYDRLERQFGEASVFMDVNNLRAGQRFDRELDKALSQCDALIAVIGPRWMELLTEHIRRGDRDFVHDEIAAALRRGIVVIPVLIGRVGQMPALPPGEQLPEDIRDLVLYQKHDIAYERFDRDAADLIAAIKSVLGSDISVSRWKPAVAIPGMLALAVTIGLLGYGIYHIARTRPGPAAVNPAATTAQSKPDANSAPAQDNTQAAPKPADGGAKAPEADTTQKAPDPAATQKAPDPAATQTAPDPAATQKKAEEESARRDADARKKADEQANAVVTECDRLAASHSDPAVPNGVAGVDFSMMDVRAATSACDDAMRRYPSVARFVFQAGRVADAGGNFARAIELYRDAAAKGEVRAITDVGDLYCFGRGYAQDYTEAKKWYEKAAALGDANAMNRLGDLYKDAWGVPQDYAEAKKWFESASELGSGDAMVNLGVLYENGLVGRVDTQKARLLYQRAMDARNIRPSNRRRAIERLQRLQ
jgi:TPR repeat protein